MGRLTDKLTYANVVSTLCLFLLLGGGAAYAASHLGKNSVGTKQLRKNAVTGPKVKDQSLTGHDVVASTLGTVPDANHASHADTAGDSSTLQGSGPAAFVHGDGSVIVVRHDMDNETPSALLIDLPGIGILNAGCPSGSVTFEFTNTSRDILDISSAQDGGSTSYSATSAGAEFGGGTVASLTKEFQFATRTAPPTFATVDVILNHKGAKGCTAIAQATLAK
jgi:hypothetical protein